MKIRSLIIDDNEFMQTLLRDVIVEHIPYVDVVDTAKNGREGILKIKKHKPDLIFLDVEMPDMTGFEMLEELGRDLNSIFITGHDHYAIQALKSEALDYLLKPVDPEELKIAIEKFELKRNRLRSNEIVRRSMQNLESLVHNILPVSIAKEIREHGLAKTTQQFDAVTVLFADIEGFSSHTRNMSPEELVRELDYCYGAFDQIMDEYGIEKIKTIGDAYMAAGGVPDPQENHAINAVRAAFDMQNFLSSYAAKRTTQYNTPFEMRIGLHTGPVVAGVVGTKKFAYDIWGDTVNIAARMESAGAVGKVNISQKTYGYIKSIDRFTCIPRGKINIKGRGNMEMYFVEPKLNII